MPNKLVLCNKHKKYLLDIKIDFNFFNQFKPSKMRFKAYSKGGYNLYDPNKVNQDAFLANLEISEQENIYVFGVYDGHGNYINIYMHLYLYTGPNGHFVSNFVKDYLPSIFL